MQSTSTLEVWTFILRESANESHPLDQVKSPYIFITKVFHFYVLPFQTFVCIPASRCVILVEAMQCTIGGTT
jgi:hypothetical protein